MANGWTWRDAVQRHFASGDLDAALVVINAVLASEPADPAARQARAVVLLAAGRAAEAVVVLRGLWEEAPSAARAFDLACALEAAGLGNEAEAVYRRALDHDPDHYGALLNLCALLQRLGQADRARTFGEHLAARHPQSPEAWCACAHARLADADATAADAAFVRALELDGGYLPAAFGRVYSLAMGGSVVAAQGQLDALRALDLPAASIDAIPRARETLALPPERVEEMHFGTLFERHRRGEWSCLPALVSALRDLAAALRADPLRPACQSLAFQALGIGLDYADYRTIVRRVFEASVAVDKPLARRPTPGGGQAARRLRLGFLSPAFRDHPSGYLTRAMYREHDRDRFIIHGYCIGVDDGSAVRRDIVAGCDHFVSLAGLDDQAAAQRIHDDGIDILVQLQGFFDGVRNGILALRPAPLNVTHIGVIGTLDAPWLDYRFCEAALDPFDPPSEFALAGLTEKRVRFADLYMPYGCPAAPWSIPVTRRESGLPEDAVVFCSFNNDYKLEPEVFGCWMEILKAVPNSVLWLFCVADPLWERCLGHAERHGIGAERLVRAGNLPNDRHLARLRLADLCLDCFVYNAHTTALDALWMGLPLLTRRGVTPAQALSSVILEQFGLPELVTGSNADYVARAVDLARDPARLGELRQRIVRSRTAGRVFNTAYKTRLYEEAYRRMWQRHCAGLPPVDLDILPLA